MSNKRSSPTQVNYLSDLIFAISGKRLSHDYRLKLLMQLHEHTSHLIQQARARTEVMGLAYIEPQRWESIDWSEMTPPAQSLDESLPAPSPDEVLAARTGRNAWNRVTLAKWGVPWPPPAGWRTRLVERYFDETVNRPMALEEMN